MFMFTFKKYSKLLDRCDLKVIHEYNDNQIDII